MMYYSHYGAGMGALSILLDIAWWVFIIAVIIVVVRSLRRGGHWHQYEQSSSLEILKQRYAKGEIDKKEFEEKKKDLGQ